MVFGWDRGLAQPAIDPLAQAIVDFLMNDRAAQGALKVRAINSDFQSTKLILTAEIRTALRCVLDYCTPAAFHAYMRQPEHEAAGQILKSLGLVRRWIDGTTPPASTPTAGMRQRRVWWK